MHVAVDPAGRRDKPRPSSTAVEVSSTTSIASMVSGLPARPTADDTAVRHTDAGAPDPEHRIEQHDIGDCQCNAAALGPQREAIAHRAAHAGGDVRRRRPLDLDLEAGVAEPRAGVRHRDSPARAPAAAPALARPARPAARRRDRRGRARRAGPRSGTPNSSAVPPGSITTFAPRLERRPQAIDGRAVELEAAVDLEEVDVGGEPDGTSPVLRAVNGPSAPSSQTSGRLGWQRRRGGAERRSGRAGRSGASRRRTAPRPRSRGTSARHAVEHVAAGQDGVAARRDALVGEPVARGLADLVRDQRRRFRLVQRAGRVPAGGAPARPPGTAAAARSRAVSAALSRSRAFLRATRAEPHCVVDGQPQPASHLGDLVLGHDERRRDLHRDAAQPASDEPVVEREIRHDRRSAPASPRVPRA